MPDEEALLPRPTHRNDIANGPVRREIPYDPVLDVAILGDGRDHDTVLGAVIGLTVLDDEAPSADDH